MSNKILDRRRWTVLLLFGLIGQIAWSVENMYFNLFVYDTVAKDLEAITLMVQLSGIVATVVTLVMGTLSDKLGKRRGFIAYGYLIWGVTVAIFGYLSPSLTMSLFGVSEDAAVQITLCAVIAGDCVMTAFGSCSNDAAFNAWVTDNTESSVRGRVESVLSILPLLAMLVVAGGFGMLVEGLGYSTVFLILGAVICICGGVGIFVIRDSEDLKASGSFRDIFYGFYPKTVAANPSLYLVLLIVMLFGVATQIFMPYLIIYMREYLGFSVLEYSLVFGLAIAFGAVINLFLGRVADKGDKRRLMFFAAATLAVGLLLMYFFRGMSHGADLLLFGIGGLVMISGYIFILALSGALVRDNTPVGEAGKLQGVRMVFSVLIPMLVGPTVGNAINRVRAIPLPNAGADAMTTEYIPAPEIFLAAAGVTLLIFAVIPLLYRVEKKDKNEG